jgi:hypothetical protein
MTKETPTPEPEENYGRTISLEEFGRELTQLRAEYGAKCGPFTITRNSGARRWRTRSEDTQPIPVDLRLQPRLARRLADQIDGHLE